MHNVVNTTFEKIERFSKLENINIDKSAKVKLALDADELRALITPETNYFNRRNDIIQDMRNQLLNALQSDEKYTGNNTVLHVALFAG